MKQVYYHLEKCIDANRILIFDGQESNLPNILNIKFPDHLLIEETFEVLTKQFLDDIETQFSTNDFYKLIISSKVEKTNVENFYTFLDEIGLDVYATIKSINAKKYLIVLSTGEVQPDRFQIYILSCWEVSIFS